MTGAGNGTVDWPVELRGITESIVATLGPNERWNFAALGVYDECPVRARTWGRTRTWRNFGDRGEGYVQFTRDPVAFTEAALSIRESDEPVLDGAAAWARVDVDRMDRGEAGETTWVDWSLSPVEAAVERRTVPTTNRGYGAVVEATVAASRLGVPAYDDATLRDRLDYFADVIERCGGPREVEALDRLEELVE
ncbi:MAG: DUF447 domain-containing protein [Salinirussus sp.]